ncbi:MAG TPA: hypothetical protein VK255_02620, partial [Patescibacteria group bacterium]|nr:hypothetical protein [Patescibacteria group bacterium]
GMHNVGNHELGYELPLTTDPMAGISKKSIRAVLEVYGRDNLYHSFVQEGIRFIFLPYLFAEESAVDLDLDILKQELLADMLQDLLKNEPVIIFLHDPDALCYRPLLGMLRIFRQKIKMVFCGHLHASEILSIFCVLIKIQNSILGAWISGIIFLLMWAAFDFRIAKKIYRYFRERKNLPGLVKEFNIQVIPAPGGMMGLGGGFLTLNINDDGTIELEKHRP